MFGSDTLEVVIGLVFIYFIMSLLCSTVTEWIARFIAMRAKTLQDGINKLLNDEKLKDKIFAHPLVKGLSPKNSGRGPSNLPARTFSLVLFDILRDAGGQPSSAQEKVASLSQDGSEGNSYRGP